MKLSNYFLPVLKENPKEAQIVSHRLMLRAGMIQQSSAGIYSWLPLGLKVLSKIEQIVREEQDNAGALEIKMPTIQPAEIWQESGRYDDYGLEMLRVKDRHERDMLYGPTNEEQVTDICRSHVKSYRALPLNLYHIQWKFRDEVRPRFGVMRGREFLMKDAYSFDLTPEDARVAYNKMFVSYLKTFARMELTAIPMEADTGPIGGDMSHEFIILADTGESGVFFHKDWLKTDLITNIDYSADLEPVIHKFTELYARTDEKHEPDNCPIKPEDLVEKRGIEVGHIFYFGTKYSKAMAASVSGRKLLTAMMFVAMVPQSSRAAEFNAAACEFRQGDKAVSVGGYVVIKTGGRRQLRGHWLACTFYRKWMSPKHFVNAKREANSKTRSVEYSACLPLTKDGKTARLTQTARLTPRGLTDVRVELAFKNPSDRKLSQVGFFQFTGDVANFAGERVRAALLGHAVLARRFRHQKWRNQLDNLPEDGHSALARLASWRTLFCLV